MSFFTKAVTRALKLFPDVNAMIDGKEIVYYDYADISIAVSSPKGLMVPVVRNAELLDFAGIESEIKRLAIKARDVGVVWMTCLVEHLQLRMEVCSGQCYLRRLLILLSRQF